MITKTSLFIAFFLIASQSFAKTIQYLAPGMTCPSCAYKIKKSFKSYVKSKKDDIKVDISTDIVTLTNVRKDLNTQKLLELAKDTGYEIKAFVDSDKTYYVSSKKLSSQELKKLNITKEAAKQSAYYVYELKNKDIKQLN